MKKEVLYMKNEVLYNRNFKKRKHEVRETLEKMMITVNFTKNGKNIQNPICDYSVDSVNFTKKGKNIQILSL